MKVHYTENYLLNPVHKITVHVVGAGGTGSQMITNLARINEALVAFGHPGLHVRCYDPDIVTEANIGRQLFSRADIGISKANVLVTRINRFFGYEWESHVKKYTGSENCNITITCVDTAATRLAIASKIHKAVKNRDPHEMKLYWLDLGNTQKTGQVVLGTLRKIDQPKSEFQTAGELKTVEKKFPQLKKVKEKDQGPSCSLAEALNKQDLFINSTLAQFGAGIIWKLFREGMITHHGAYVNLESLRVNPITI